MKIAIDTNVLANAEGLNGATRHQQSLDVLRSLPPDDVVVPVQVLGELFNVLVRKANRSRAAARAALMAWRDAFAVVETSPNVLVAALDLATDHQLAIWDAVIISAASQSGCRLLLSEDLQDGFSWGGVTVVNPFASSRHDLLKSLLRTLT